MFSEVSQSNVMVDLQAVSGDKSKLMQEYSKQMQDIINKYGGNVTDIPIDPDNEYYKLQAKLQILNRMGV